MESLGLVVECSASEMKPGFKNWCEKIVQVTSKLYQGGMETREI